MEVSMERNTSTIHEMFPRILKKIFELPKDK